MVIGLAVDFWQQSVMDIGIFGANEGKGGRDVVVGPDTPERPKVEDATLVESRTNNLCFVFRLAGTPEQNQAAMDGIKVYYHGDAPSFQIIDAKNVNSGMLHQPRGLAYWKLLHEVLQEEPVADRDRFFMYWLTHLGIEKGKRFDPDTRQRALLEDASFVGGDTHQYAPALYDGTTPVEPPDDPNYHLIEAVKYNVLPIDDRTAERFNTEIAGRPDLMAGRSSMRLDGYAKRVSENAAPNTKNKSFAVTAELVVPEGGAEGVIATQGGAFGGWSLYAKEGKLKYCYNFIGLEHIYVETKQPLQPGERQVRIEFKYDGGGTGKGADLLLFVEGEQVGEGRTERSIPYIISLDETLDIGTDAGTPATDDYPARGNEFNGTINWVQIDLEPDDHSHMIDAEHMAHVRLVKQ